MLCVQAVTNAATQMKKRNKIAPDARLLFSEAYYQMRREA